MAEFVTVAKTADLSDDAGHVVEVKGRLIALFGTDGGVHAIDDCCPHMGASLATGHVSDGVVTCPWHAWRFRITDGIWADAPDSGTRVNAYRAEVRGDRVLLEVTW